MADLTENEQKALVVAGMVLGAIGTVVALFKVARAVAENDGS